MKAENSWLTINTLKQYKLKWWQNIWANTAGSTWWLGLGTYCSSLRPMNRSSSSWMWWMTSARFWSMSRVWSRTCLRLGHNRRRKWWRLVNLKLICKTQATWLMHWFFWVNPSPYWGECTSWRCILCCNSSNCPATANGRMCPWGHRCFKSNLQPSTNQQRMKKRTLQKLKLKSP